MTIRSVPNETASTPSMAPVEVRLGDHRGFPDRLPLEAWMRVCDEAGDVPEISGEPEHTL